MRQHSGHGGSAETSAASSAQIMSMRVDNCSAVCACDRRKAALKSWKKRATSASKGEAGDEVVVPRTRESAAARAPCGRAAEDGLAGTEPLRMTNATSGAQD